MGVSERRGYRDTRKIENSSEHRKKNKVQGRQWCKRTLHFLIYHSKVQGRTVPTWRAWNFLHGSSEESAFNWRTNSRKTARRLNNISGIELSHKQHQWGFTLYRGYAVVQPFECRKGMIDPHWMATLREHINTDDQPRDFGTIIFRWIHRDTRWFHRLNELTHFKTSIPSFNESWLVGGAVPESQRSEYITVQKLYPNLLGFIHPVVISIENSPVNPQVGSILSISHWFPLYPHEIRAMGREEKAHTPPTKMDLATSVAQNKKVGFSWVSV